MRQDADFIVVLLEKIGKTVECFIYVFKSAGCGWIFIGAMLEKM